jgi:hypothetical protein
MNILEGFKLCRKSLHWYPVTQKGCPACRSIYKKKWAISNRERHRESQRKYYESNTERVKKSKKEWEKRNYKKKREIDKKWNKLNSSIKNAHCAKRRALKKQAIPAWADLTAIKAIYEEASRLTKETGLQYTVDHIYPLQSKYMCGLHVETNLQILTKSENSIKSNRTWPGQLDCQKN